MEMHGLNLIIAGDNVLLTPETQTYVENAEDPVTNASITLTLCWSDGYSNFPFIYRCAGWMNDD